MIRTLGTIAAILVSTSSVMAADVAQRVDWSGAYLGGSVNYSSANFDWHDLDGSFDYSNETSESFIGPQWDEVFATDDTAIGLAMQLGFMKYQTEKDLLGVELSLGLPGLKDSRQTCHDFNPCDVDSKLSWDGTLRLKWGRDYGTLMPYVAGGLAFGKFDHSFVEELNLPHSWPDVGGTAWGWTLGAGAEYALSAKWSLKGEINYTDFSDETAANDIDKRMRVSRDIWAGMIGLNYRLGN